MEYFANAKVSLRSDRTEGKRESGANPGQFPLL